MCIRDSLNSLIGSKNIENDFKNLVAEYPKVLKCIPILLAVRSREIYAIEDVYKRQSLDGVTLSPMFTDLNCLNGNDSFVSSLFMRCLLYTSRCV